MMPLDPPSLNDARCAAELVGKSIFGVRYCGHWTTSPYEPHAYVLWIDVASRDLHRFRITSDFDFGSYSVVVLDLGSEALTTAETDIDSDYWSPQPGEPWTPYLGSRIVGVRGYVHTVQVFSGPRKGEVVAYIRDLAIDCDGVGPIYFSVASLADDQTLEWGLDSICAIHGDAEAARLGVGPFGDPSLVV